MTDPDSTLNNEPLILYGYTKATEAGAAERLISLAITATTYGTKLIEVLLEPDNGRRAQFHRLVGAIKFHRQSGNEQPIIVIVHERHETERATLRRLWAEHRLNELNTEVVFAEWQAANKTS